MRKKPFGEVYQKFVEEYKAANHPGKMELAKKFGVSYATLKDWIVTGDTPHTTEIVKIAEKPEDKRIPYPDFKIKPFVVGKRIRDKEDMVLEFADRHFGKVTEDYNLDIAQKRMNNLLTTTMRIIELHRPIGKLYIFNVGDNVQGENIYQGSRIGETACGAFEQIYDYAVPIDVRFLVSISQCVEAIEYYGVPGNHGKYGKEATPLSNWDNFFYKALEHATINQKNIKIHCFRQFYQMVNIQGFKNFIFHGDQVRTNYGIPSYGLRRKLQEWYAHFGGFHYAHCGHWHTWEGGQVNEVARFEVCPPLVTGDEWAIEVIGRASKPIQLCFGIHPKKGQTWKYQLYTDPNHFPVPYGEK